MAGRRGRDRTGRVTMLVKSLTRVRLSIDHRGHGRVGAGEVVDESSRA